jgi:hypothetical protein
MGESYTAIVKPFISPKKCRGPRRYFLQPPPAFSDTCRVATQDKTLTDQVKSALSSHPDVGTEISVVTKDQFR